MTGGTVSLINYLHEIFRRFPNNNKNMYEPNQCNVEKSANDVSRVPSRRGNTLKDRIKRAMASDESRSRVNSVLTAASALASLGSDTPARVSDHSRMNDEMRTVGSLPPMIISRMENADVIKTYPLRLDNDVPMTFPQKVSCSRA